MTKIDLTATKPVREDNRAGRRTDYSPDGDRDPGGDKDPDGDRDAVHGAERQSPRLLVSVRERGELLVALAAKVDIIDLKEPRHGALSPVEPAFWRETVDIWNQSASAPDRESLVQTDSAQKNSVQTLVSTRPVLSAALGEADEARSIVQQLPAAFRYAKVGPSGCDSVDKLRQLWHLTRDRLHEEIQLVAVSYADYGRAQCVSPQQVFEAASEFGLQTCLIDTFIKDGQSTLDLLGLRGVGRISNIARDHRLRWTLAGSVRVGDVAKLRREGITPDCFGVRGDVCRQGRTGSLSADRIEAWRNALQA